MSDINTSFKPSWFARFVRSRYASFEFIVGSFLTCSLVVLVLLSGVLFPGGGTEVNLIARLSEPFQSSAFPLGTDPLGRDILARIVHGGRISLLVGLFSALGAVVVGTIIGLFAGYYRGFLDAFVMRL